MRDRAAATQPERAGVWRAILAGLCASLVGIGLARFAYTPLIPALIAAGWFSPSEAAYLGAANLAGYLAGALLGRRLATLAPAAPVLRAAMLLATAAFFACAGPWPFWWFSLWRFLAGLAGGALMVLAAPTVLSHVPPARRGLAGGAVFTGVGLGIAASGTVVPPLLQWGLAQAWLGLGALALLLTVLAWGGWPRSAAPAPAPHAARAAPAPDRPLRALYLAYGLNAVGVVPHMVFLVDYVARGLGQGIATGASYWALFGLGAMAGPVLAGHLADRVGFRPALRLALAVQAVAVALPAMAPGPIWLAVSSVVVGAFVPGVVPLALGRVHELLAHADPARRAAGWSAATTAFAVGQAAAAYGFSALFAHGGSYALLFALGALALLAALAVDLGLGRAARAP